jgi:hypothetical protein
LDDLVVRHTTSTSGILCVYKPRQRIAKAMAIYKEFFGTRKMKARSLEPLSLQQKAVASAQHVGMRLDVPGTRKRKAGSEHERQAKREHALQVAVSDICGRAKTRPCCDGVQIPTPEERHSKRLRLMGIRPSQQQCSAKWGAEQPKKTKNTKSLAEQLASSQKEVQRLRQQASIQLPKPAAAKTPALPKHAAAAARRSGQPKPNNALGLSHGSLISFLSPP